MVTQKSVFEPARELVQNWLRIALIHGVEQLPNPAANDGVIHIEPASSMIQLTQLAEFIAY
jgi:hypothetical protein